MGYQLKLKGTILLSIALLMVLGVFWLLQSPFLNSEVGNAEIYTGDITQNISAIRGEKTDLLSLEIPSGFNELFARDLQNKYGASINDIRVQASMIKVREQLIRRFPGQGTKMFSDILYLAFPEYADRILELVQNLLIYYDWLANNQLALSEMSLLEQNGFLWGKRHELFGKNAELLWEKEQLEIASKRKELKTFISHLDQSEDISVDEKLYQLQTAVDETFGGLESQAVSHSVVAQVFFGFESVQDSLRDLDPDIRRERINELRHQLGYSQEQIALLQKRDDERNRRWENGYAYMAEREKLVSELSGEDLEVALNHLQEIFFKHEAKTIRLEEENGFFRFQRQRIYGRN